LLWWVLPAERPGYAQVRVRIETMQVVAIGRRGDGNLVLAAPKHRADLESPLPSAIAFGELVAKQLRGSVTVREEFEGQIEVEIVEPGSGAHEHRWTYSEWLPGRPCPQCSAQPRVVGMSTESGSPVSLAICPQDRRLWVHSGRTGICRPVPVTLFYSELMRRTGVRDPRLALRSDRLFEALGTFTEADLAVAFISYNHVRTKIADDDPLRPPVPRRSFFRRWFSFYR
jgi:hypothetical protein